MANDAPPRKPAPGIQPVISFGTPKQDVVFYVMEDSRLPANTHVEYGKLFKDQQKYPGYKLCYISAASEDGWQKHYYAAPRENQDAYNYQERGGESFSRTYVVPRGEYPDIPEGGTSDAVFTNYGFTGRSVQAAEPPLEGVFDIVTHHYAVKVNSSERYDPALDAIVTVVKRIIPKGSGTSSKTAGQVVEIEGSNVYYDLEVTTTTPTGDRILPTLPSFENYRFPSRLNSISIEYATAFADSTQATPSYSEDFYFKYDITEPKPGPYPAKIYRTITADPEALLAGVAVNTVPSPKRETLGLVYAWYHASNKGNRTSALAREILLPECIHTSVTVTINGSALPAGASHILNPTSLPATPGFSGNISGEIAVGASTRMLPLGMFEVQIVKLYLATGVYG